MSKSKSGMATTTNEQLSTDETMVLNGNLYILPLSMFILIPGTILITYIVAVESDHVTSRFPYISEIVSLSPESCVFAQFLNISVFILMCCMYVRHREILQWQNDKGSGVISKRMITLSAWCGAFSCIGLDVLGNFQERAVVVVHMCGAITFFVACTSYFCLQTYISYLMVPAATGMIIVYIRAGLSVLTLILTTATIIPGYISMIEFHGADYAKWAPTDGGWSWHVVSVISEWLLVLTYAGIFITYVPEFRLINMQQPVLTLTYLGKDQNTNK